MLGVPAPTPYDLRFTLLGVPVRVQPLFWIISAALGWGEPKHVLIWVACVFVSIMVHEFGHALANRAFGVWPVVVLHGFGGLCISDGTRPLRPWQRFLVIAAGPLAGLSLFLLVVGFLLMRGILEAGELGPVGKEIVRNLVWINLGWSLLNLLPVFPLDGGQLAAILLEWRSPGHGYRHAFLISIVAGLGAAALLAKWGIMFSAIFFVLLAFQNFQFYQASRSSSYYG